MNNYYAHTRQGMYIKKHGKAYRKATQDAVNEQCSNIGHLPLTDRLSVTVILAPPDNRVRDVDNYMKCLLDALTHAGVWVDDSQIDQLPIYRAKKIRNGAVYVRIDDAEPVLPFEFMIKNCIEWLQNGKLQISPVDVLIYKAL